MAQNFLYMFEFVVDDLLITRPNVCAPEEYPTCCEISFRSSVFIQICDREFGHCVDVCAPKCGKCCLFSLESPVTDKDRLLIHIYKKKTDKCKFLVGATDLPIKPLFDKVTESFNIENPNWKEKLAQYTARVPDPKNKQSNTTVVDNDVGCDEESYGRREQMCPTSELTKRLLPLFNMKQCQTGNIVLIMRLVCNGPNIVSSFPFSKVCTTSCPSKKKDSCRGANSNPCPCGEQDSRSRKSSQKKPYCQQPDPCEKEPERKQVCQRYFACNADRGCPCEECEDDCDRECPTVNCGKPKKKSRCGGGAQQSCCPQDDPCQKKGPKINLCERFFSSTDKCGSGSGSCPCEECADECEAAKARALRKLRYLMQKYSGEN